MTSGIARRGNRACNSSLAMHPAIASWVRYLTYAICALQGTPANSRRFALLNAAAALARCERGRLTWRHRPASSWHCECKSRARAYWLRGRFRLLHDRSGGMPIAGAASAMVMRSYVFWNLRCAATPTSGASTGSGNRGLRASRPRSGVGVRIRNLAGCDPVKREESRWRLARFLETLADAREHGRVDDVLRNELPTLHATQNSVGPFEPGLLIDHVASVLHERMITRVQKAGRVMRYARAHRRHGYH